MTSFDFSSNSFEMDEYDDIKTSLHEELSLKSKNKKMMKKKDTKPDTAKNKVSKKRNKKKIGFSKELRKTYLDCDNEESDKDLESFLFGKQTTEMVQEMEQEETLSKEIEQDVEDSQGSTEELLSFSISTKPGDVPFLDYRNDEEESDQPEVIAYESAFLKRSFLFVFFVC